ncbi:MAG: DUF4469 domain-containing protein [Leptospiraceae bacterium]|nr:DUF4469 domain-containing protein [Leptospiraceae bacterium]MCP5503405.1 DUF4469 domain-containing protein [Leptospiraceae bacterium]
MSIKYSLHRTVIGNADNKFHSRVVTPQVFNREELVKRMLDSGTSVTRSDILAVLNLLESTVTNVLLEGGRINLDGFIQFYPLIQGVFNDEFDNFDSSKHKIDVGVRASSELKQLVSQAKVEKVESQVNLPVMKAFIDFKTGERNSSIFPGTIAALKGKNLKFNPEREDEGLYIQNMQDMNYTRIETLSKNAALELNFLVPPVINEGNTYRFELRNRMQASNTLKVTRLSFALTGAA